MSTTGELTLAALRDEFKTFAEGVETLARTLETSDDRDELRLFLSTVAEWRAGLYLAEAPATLRLQMVEIQARHNRLSWTETS